MNDTELVQHMIDSLDTGLPERPDLTPVRLDGARRRWRRRLGWGAGAVAAAAVLVVPSALLAGSGGTSPAVAPDVAADPAPAVAPEEALPPVPRNQLAGPEFGVGMRAAIEQAIPGVTFRSETLGDGWEFSDQYDAYDYTVGDPVGWDTLFLWDQYYRLPGGAHLDVLAERTAPDGLMGMAGPTECNQAHYPSRLGCEAFDVGAQRVVVNDGIQYEDNGRWYRDVEVSYFDETRGMAAHVSISAFADAPTWAQARELLPSADELTALGVEPALVLPAPDHYPTPDDLDEHGSSKP